MPSYDVKGITATPTSTNLFVLRGSEPLSKELIMKFFSRTKLLYLAKRVRPGILTSIAFLTTRTRTPTPDDNDKLEQRLRYLNGTKEFGMMLGSVKDVHLTGYKLTARATP